LIRGGVAALALLSGVFAVAAGAVELDIPVFAGGYGIDFYQQVAREFERVRPGVAVHLYGDPRIQDQVRVRIIDGHYPDAASVPYILWPALMRAGRLIDLTPRLEGRNWEGDARWGDTFLPGALDSWRMEGRIYGLPFTYACWTLFYNRGMFRAHGWSEPKTWDDFLGLCRRMRAAGVAPLSLPGTRWLYPDTLLRAAYHNLAGPAGWADVNALAPGAWLDPRFVRSAALLRHIMREDVLAGWEGETAPGAELAFLQGRAAMTVSGSWFFNEMRGRLPDSLDVGAMNFPVFRDGVADPTTIQAQSDCFFVFATGDRVREGLTVEFLRFLTSRAHAEAFVRATDAPVAVQGVPLAAYSERMRDTARMIAGARAAFNMPQQMLLPASIRQARVDDTTRLMTGALTPEGYARRLETASASDRAQLREPDHLDYRHGLAGGALLAFLALVAGGFAAGSAGRRLRRVLTGGGAAPAGGAEPARGAAFGRLRGRFALGFVGPALCLYAAIVLLPALASFGWAFVHWDGIGAPTWAGWFNFKSLLFASDPFWQALGNNAYLMVVPALAVVPLALFFAALIQRGVWGAGAFRTVLLFPNLLGGIAATLLWLNAYAPHGGLVNASLVGLGHRLHLAWLAGFADYPWLSEAHLYRALLPIYLWLACGFNLVLYLAAMEGIDPQLYEAAELEGASAVRQFFTITLPLIREVIAVSAVFLVIGGLNAFEMIWLLTSQEPTAPVHTLATLLVTLMFKNFEIGRAAALAVVLFGLVAAVSAVLFRGLRGEAVADA
jgi:raffinose/stachyose/melibiose transport system permease protein